LQQRRRRSSQAHIDSTAKNENKQYMDKLGFGLLDPPIHPTHAFISKA
jgi:hypothetical protein